MGNIKNFNFNKLDFKLSNSGYWDFFLASDDSSSAPSGPPSSGDCFVVWYDFNNDNIYPNSASTASTIYSLITWDNAVNTGYTLNTIGLTGIDNGLVSFDKVSGDTSNQALLSALTGTTLIIPSGDTRLTLNKVSGSTNQFIYPIDIVSATTIGNYAQFCGGFYQGYYKIDGTTYDVLPTRVNQAWGAEFWLNPQSLCSGYTGTTLNDTYPDNKGFFFYMGTRAENKFWNQFSGVDSGCTSGCTQESGCTDTLSEWCTIPRENQISLIGDYGVAIPLDPPRIEIDLITNNFLIYGRANSSGVTKYTGDSGTMLFSTANTETVNYRCGVCGRDHNGLGSETVCSYDGNGIVVVKSAEIITNNQNPFLIYGRASTRNISGCTCNRCCGSGDDLGNKTVCTFTGMTSPEEFVDYNNDLIDNALGFRIKDDGSIGYRMLLMTGSCTTASTGEKIYTSGITVQEDYSQSGVVSSDTWSYIAVRFVTNYEDDCILSLNKPRVGKLMFYVNAKLKYVVDDFPELMAKRLDEYKLKQVGVPFNISLGGGSQGLLESQTFDGLDSADRGLPIEENFAGTFIGGISQFKYNICDLSFENIKYNYNNDIDRYLI